MPQISRTPGEHCRAAPVVCDILCEGPRDLGEFYTREESERLRMHLSYDLTSITARRDCASQYVTNPPCVLVRFPGYTQSDESGDGAKDESAAGEQAEHAQGSSAHEQAQPSEHTQVSPLPSRYAAESGPVHFCPVKLRQSRKKIARPYVPNSMTSMKFLPARPPLLISSLYHGQIH